MKKFILPNDFKILKLIVESEKEVIIGGGVADQLHINKFKIEQETHFEDLDIIVTNKFIDLMSNSFEHLDLLIKSKKFLISPFDSDGTISNSKKEIIFKNSKYESYPAQMRAFMHGKLIDIFIHPWELQEFLEIEYLGINLKITSLKNRIKMIESILEKNFMNHKREHFEKKLKLLRNIQS
jgi:hypothetical protein